MPLQTQPPDVREIHAYLHLQMQAMIFLRSRSGDLPREQIGDLADALHTLPEFIWPGLWSNAEFRRLYLEPYDRKWSKMPGSPSLVAILEEGFQRST
jgi:hypothetical protein